MISEHTITTNPYCSMRDVILDQMSNFPGLRVTIPKRIEIELSGKRSGLSAWLLPTKKVDRHGNNKSLDITVTEMEECFVLRNNS